MSNEEKRFKPRPFRGHGDMLNEVLIAVCDQCVHDDLCEEGHGCFMNEKVEKFVEDIFEEASK